MIAARNDIPLYIPQRNPFVAIHEISNADDHQAHTRFFIMEGSVFVTNRKITEAGLIENMAQTAAAQMGVHCKKNGLAVPTGFIAAVKHLSIHFLPAVGESLETVITINNKVMDIVLFDAVVSCGGKTVCECEMRVYIHPAPEKTKI